MQTATFGAGCFWGVEHAFSLVPGVVETEVGYTGGTTENPTYKDVCGHGTGHAEAVRVKFDETRVSYRQLLGHFWEIHDPTQVGGQGPDMGSQYRSVIFPHDPEQEAAAREAIRDLENSGRFDRPIATSIEPAGPFWPAEEYHQKYFQKHPEYACPVRKRIGI